MDYLEKDKAVFAASMSADEPYTLGPDSFAQDGVPRGSISKHHWVSTTIYPAPSATTGSTCRSSTMGRSLPA